MLMLQIIFGTFIPKNITKFTCSQSMFPALSHGKIIIGGEQSFSYQ